MDIKQGKNGFYVGNEERPEALITFKDNGEKLSIDHTKVNDNLRGQGVGHDLFMKVVDYARDEGKKLEATCPFAASEIKKHEADIKDVL